MSRRRKPNSKTQHKSRSKQKGATKKSHSKVRCPSCGFTPCADIFYACEDYRAKIKRKGNKNGDNVSHFQFCYECEEVTEMYYDTERNELFCKECCTTIEENMINLPDSVKKGPGASSAYQGNWQGGTMAPACEHKGDKVIFEKDGKKLYAANNKGMDEFSGKWELILDLGQIIPTPSPGFVKQSNSKKFDVLRQFTGKYAQPKSEILRLDWPDYSAPAVTPDFWTKLWEIMPEKTCAVCIGGHGRTGTCLAAFMIAVGGVDYYSAFTTVRTEHCEKAIESLGQARYLHGLYIEMLKRQMTEITAKGDFIALAALQESMEYATKHVPTSSDLLGDETIEISVPTAAKGYIDTKKSDSSSNIDKTKYPDVQCSSCSSWIERSLHFNDYWCDKCKKSITAVSKLDSGEDFEQATIKRVNGILYIKECMDPACGWAEKEDCDDPDHLAWVKWDDYQYMEARVS